MSQKSLRGRIPTHRRIRPSQSHPSSSTYKLHRRVLINRSLENPLKVIKRCKSEPALSTLDLSGDDAATVDGVIAKYPAACMDGLSPAKIEGYDKDGKVVVNVTVEGSPGPVRTMVKLGSSVQETMELIKKQYNSEGRSPQLNQHSLSNFELHQSYFSLHGLDKSDMIGDIGSRSFYMRKCNNDNSGFMGSEIILTKENNSPPQNPSIVFPNFITCCFKKIMKLSIKLSKILGCIDR